MIAVLAPVEQLVAAVYVSSATRHLSEDENIGILRSAREHNEKSGVTGMLLYRDGNFMQVLEGPAGVVDSLFFRRFVSAILLSVISGGGDALAASGSVPKPP